MDAKVQALTKKYDKVRKQINFLTNHESNTDN
jgi:hypothetical protein